VLVPLITENRSLSAAVGCLGLACRAACACQPRTHLLSTLTVAPQHVVASAPLPHCNPNTPFDPPNANVAQRRSIVWRLDDCLDDAGLFAFACFLVATAPTLVALCSPHLSAVAVAMILIVSQLCGALAAAIQTYYINRLKNFFRTEWSRGKTFPCVRFISPPLHFFGAAFVLWRWHVVVAGAGRMLWR